MDSDELDFTISGSDRVSQTLANAASLLLNAKGINIAPRDLLPGMDAEPGTEQSAEEQILACNQIVAFQNASAAC